MLKINLAAKRPSRVALPQLRLQIPKSFQAVLLAAGILTGGISVTSCNKPVTGKKNPGKKYLEISIFDLMSALNKLSGKLSACDITAVNVDKRIGSNATERTNNLATELATHIIGTIFNPKRAEAKSFIGSDLRVRKLLQQLAPNQTQDVITRLANSKAMQNIAGDLGDLLSSSQKDAILRACDKKSAGLFHLKSRFSGQSVLEDLTLEAIIKIIKEVQKQVSPSAAPIGSAKPEVIVCSIDDTRLPFSPYETTQGSKSDLVLKGQTLNIPNGARIRLDFGHGITPSNIRISSSGIKAKIRVANNASLGIHKLVIYVNGKKVRTVARALDIKQGSGGYVAPPTVMRPMRPNGMRPRPMRPRPMRPRPMRPRPMRPRPMKPGLPPTDPSNPT